MAETNDTTATAEKKAPAIVQSQEMPLKDITPNKGQIPGVPKNPRVIRDQKFRLLKKSIEEDPEMLGLREILLFPYQGKNIIIGGNMRYQALKDLGYTSAIVKILPADFTPEKLRAIVIKDNSGFGEWDWDALADEWEAAQLIDWGLDVPDLGNVKADEEAEEDDYDPSDDLEKPAKTREGDIYALGRHRLICGDSTDPQIIDILCGSTVVDLYLTDPPYNVNYEGSNGKKIANDNMSDGNFQEFLFDAFSVANEHLKQGGAFYIWHADSEGYNFRTAAKRVGWTIRQCLIWNKNSLVLGRQDYQWKHEPCLYGWKDGGSHYFVSNRSLTTVLEQPLDLDAMTKAEMKKLLASMLGGDVPTTVIDENKPLRNAEHPTMKPLKLMGRCVKNSTRPGEVVLDSFGGSGSTLMACEQLGRVCFTVELDPHYVDVIIKRWEEYTQEEAQYIGNINDNK